jgi:hypothetical protein
MTNMSYCRFRNTDRDLSDCEDALEALYHGEGKLPPEEFDAAVRLIERCAAIVYAFAEAAGLDTARSLDDLVEDMGGPTEVFVNQELALLNDGAEEAT